MTKTTFPVQLVVEVDDTWDPETQEYPTDTISLVAYVGTERHILAATDVMTGYDAKNNPQGCLKLLLQDMLR